MEPRPFERPPVSHLPLVVAAAALVLVAWIAADRFLTTPIHGDAEPRTVAARGELASFEETSIRVFEANAPSVVHVSSRAIRPTRTLFGVTNSVQEGTGTGFVWDERGYVVTNYHVIQNDRSRVRVRLQGLEEYDAVVVGTEQQLDIAVVRIANPPSGLRAIPIGSSSDLKVGQAVFAIGNPFGLDHTLTSGIVSALDRQIESPIGTPIQGAIQVDAAINPGNSGGPLLDSAGRLIGMNSAIVSPSGANAGIGFAVPIDVINRVVPRLIRGEEGSRPALGVVLRSIPLDGREQRLIVFDVEPQSGAAIAGLRPTTDDRYGDILLRVDGSEIRDLQDLQGVLDQKEVGQTVDVVVLRHLGGREFEEAAVEVTLNTEVPRRR